METIYTHYRQFPLQSDALKGLMFNPCNVPPKSLHKVRGKNVVSEISLCIMSIANRHSHAHHSLIGKTQTMYGGIIPAQQICRLPVLMLVNLIYTTLIQHNILNFFSMEI